MEGWEKTKSVATILSAVAIPVVLLVIGNVFTSALKEREVQGKFVEIAVAILKEPPQPETRPLRSWATDVINKYSGVPLSGQTQALLRDKLTFPKDFPKDFPKGDWSFFIGQGIQYADTVGMLRELGYITGPTDDWTLIEQYPDAVRRFQQDNKLPVTGLTDFATIREMRKQVERLHSRKPTK